MNTHIWGAAMGKRYEGRPTLARSILRNDYYCKGLGQTQSKSEAYQKFKSIQLNRRKKESYEINKSIEQQVELF